MSTAWRFLSIFISSMINNGVQVVPSRWRTLVTVSPSDEALAEQSLATSSGKDDDEEMEESLNDYNSGRAGAAEREEEQRASAVNPRSARPVLANVKQAIESDDDDKGGLEDISDGHVMGTDGEVETESLSEDNVDLESDGDQPMSIDVASSDSEGEDGAVDELLPFEDRLSDGDEMLDYTSRAVPWVEHGSADVNWYSNHRIIVKSGYRYDKPYRASGFGTLEPGQRGPLVAIEESKIAGKVVEHFLQRLPDGDHKCACCADQAIKSKDASKAVSHLDRSSFGKRGDLTRVRSSCNACADGPRPVLDVPMHADRRAQLLHQAPSREAVPRAR